MRFYAECQEKNGRKILFLIKWLAPKESFGVTHFYTKCVFILRELGLAITPRSVIIAVIYFAGVMSNAGFSILNL
jgi:hypothetical protein